MKDTQEYKTPFRDSEEDPFALQKKKQAERPGSVRPGDLFGVADEESEESYGVEKSYRRVSGKVQLDSPVKDIPSW